MGNVEAGQAPEEPDPEMSSFSGLSDDDFWRRIDRMLAPIPNPDNRKTLRRYLKERLANGIKTSTLACDANAVRGLCLHLGELSLESITREDVTDYVTHAFAQRSWTSRSKDGEETTTKRRVRIGEGTLSIRKHLLGFSLNIARCRPRRLPKQATTAVETLRNRLSAPISSSSPPDERPPPLAQPLPAQILWRRT